MVQSLHVFFVQWGRGSAPKTSGRTFEKLCDIRKYAHPDFLAKAQCNLGGHTIERVRYIDLITIKPNPAAFYLRDGHYRSHCNHGNVYSQVCHHVHVMCRS